MGGRYDYNQASQVSDLNTLLSKQDSDMVGLQTYISELQNILVVRQDSDVIAVETYISELESIYSA